MELKNRTTPTNPYSALKSAKIKYITAVQTQNGVPVEKSITKTPEAVSAPSRNVTSASKQGAVQASDNFDSTKHAAQNGARVTPSTNLTARKPLPASTSFKKHDQTSSASRTSMKEPAPACSTSTTRESFQNSTTSKSNEPGVFTAPYRPGGEVLKKRAPTSVLQSKLTAGFKRGRDESHDLDQSATRPNEGNESYRGLSRTSLTGLNKSPSQQRSLVQSPVTQAQKQSLRNTSIATPKRIGQSLVIEGTPSIVEDSFLDEPHDSMPRERAQERTVTILISPAKPSEPAKKGDESRSSKHLALAQDLDQVRDIIKKHLGRQVVDHQYLVKAWLPRHRTIVKRAPPTQHSLKQGKTDVQSPFSNVKKVDRNPSTSKKVHTPYLINEECYGSSAQAQPSSTCSNTGNFNVYTTAIDQLPHYSACSTVKHNLLAENVTKLAGWPYMGAWDASNEDIDVKLYPELKERYYHENPDDRQKEVLQSRENVKQLVPYIITAMLELGITVYDVVRHYLGEKGRSLADIFSPKSIPELGSERVEDGELTETWLKILSTLDATTKEIGEIVECAAQALQKQAGISLWHVARYRCQEEVKTLAGKTREKFSTPSVYQSLACRICHLHDCEYHGEFKEGHELLDADDGSDIILNASDDEDPTTINRKVRVNGHRHPKPPGQPGQPQLAYHAGFDSAMEIDSSLEYRLSFVGIGAKGRMTGNWNEAANAKGTRPAHADDKFCSAQCFWEKQNRRESCLGDKWTEKDYAVFRGFLPAFGSNKRGPCMIAKAMNKQCNRVFVEMLSVQSGNAAVEQTSTHVNPSKKIAPKKLLTKKNGSREPFVPCNHTGTCEQARCRCYRHGIPCEKSCFCAKECDRRFRGCVCARIGKICWQNPRCACFRNDRECDVDLCGTCGADEVLDPLNKYNTNILVGRCKNIRIQRNIPKHTILGTSEVSGFGLFAGEDIKKEDYIAEYKGELISKEESDRRGATYEFRSANYLFKVNNSQDVDGTYESNKTRFINNASDVNNRNCEPALFLCNDVIRIAFWALRDIKAGEELFFDYGYPADKMASFYEKAEINGKNTLVKATAAKPSQKRAHRKAKADAQSSLMSGQKQLETARGPDDSSQRQEYDHYGIMQSDDENGVDSEEERAQLQAWADRQGNDDDDYEEGEHADDDAGDDEQDARGRQMILRSRRAGAEAETPVSSDSTPVRRSRKRQRSP